MFETPSDVLTFSVYLFVAIPFYETVNELLRRKTTNWAFIYFLLVFAFVNLYNGLNFDGVFMSYPQLALLFIPVLFMSGPVDYNIGLFAVYGKKANHSFVFQLMPAWLLFIAFSLAYLFQPQSISQITFRAVERHETNIIQVIIFGAMIHHHIYMIALIKHFVQATKAIVVNRYRMIVFILFLVYANVLNIFFLYGDRVNETWMMATGLTGNNLTLLILLSVRARYPRFYSNIIEEFIETKYRNVSMRNVDAKKVIANLYSLMEKEKLYENADLRVLELAQRLNITQPQLSKILDEHLNKNFNDFVNHYRVEAAKKWLLNRPDDSIIRIAYDCGFNSKSSFNSVFQKATGATPTAYRNKKARKLRVVPS